MQEVHVWKWNLTRKMRISKDRPEWHGIKGVFVDFTGLDHHAVKITKHKNPLYSDQYEPHGKNSRFCIFGISTKSCLMPCHSGPTPFKRIVGDFIEYYNTTRLHSAIGFIAPKDRLEGCQTIIHQQRDKKLEEARERRKISRQKLSPKQPLTTH